MCRAVHTSHILERPEKAPQPHLHIGFATCESQSSQNEGENHMILSTGKKKHLTKVNTFMVKALNTAGTGGNGRDMVRAMCVNAHREHRASWWKAESSPSKVKNRTRVPLSHSVHTALEFLAEQSARPTNKQQTQHNTTAK